MAMTGVGALATWWFPADGRAVRWLICLGVLARLAAALAPPFTSNDIYRYLWDGHLLLEGLDPWQASPSGVGAAHWPLPPDNRDIASLYPPGAMGLFALAALGGPIGGLWLWKAMVLAASVTSLVLAQRLARDTPGQRWLPLMALSPLLVLEGGVGAHLDLVSALPLLGALLLVRRRAFVGAGALLGVGALVKLLPLVALLPLVVACGRRAGARATFGATVVLALGYTAPAAFGWSAIGSLGQFMARWRFGTPVALTERMAGAQVAIGVTAALFVVLLAWSAWRAHRGGFEHGLPFALVAPLVASPVAFPWYLAPLASTTATAPTALVVAWASLAPLSYEVIDSYRLTGQFEPAAWPLWLATAGLAAAFAFDVLARHAWASSAAPARETDGRTA
ncbi:MAG: DUF2029 domain-containing protein [Deltaproteobacteria bacterium]|nr:DUF2029 domain-containing protein [Deltaproteobacteria bacterium]